MQSLLIEKSAKRMKHEDKVSIKAEMCQEEQSATSSATKYKRGLQQQIASKISCKDRCFSAQARFFIHSPSYPSFRTFRDKSFSQMMSTVSGGNEFSSLIIPHLKTY